MDRSTFQNTLRTHFHKPLWRLNILTHTSSSTKVRYDNKIIDLSVRTLIWKAATWKFRKKAFEFELCWKTPSLHFKSLSLTALIFVLLVNIDRWLPIAQGLHARAKLGSIDSLFCNVGGVSSIFECALIFRSKMIPYLSEFISVNGCLYSSPTADSVCFHFIRRNKCGHVLFLIAKDLFCPVLLSFTSLYKQKIVWVSVAKGSF